MILLLLIWVLINFEKITPYESYFEGFVVSLFWSWRTTVLINTMWLTAGWKVFIQRSLRANFSKSLLDLKWRHQLEWNISTALRSWRCYSFLDVISWRTERRWRRWWSAHFVWGPTRQQTPDSPQSWLLASCPSSEKVWPSLKEEQRCHTQPENMWMIQHCGERFSKKGPSILHRGWEEPLNAN